MLECPFTKTIWPPQPILAMVDSLCHKLLILRIIVTINDIDSTLPNSMKLLPMKIFAAGRRGLRPLGNSFEYFFVSPFRFFFQNFFLSYEKSKSQLTRLLSVRFPGPPVHQPDHQEPFAKYSTQFENTNTKYQISTNTKYQISTNAKYQISTNIKYQISTNTKCPLFRKKFQKIPFFQHSHLSLS